MMRQPAFFIPRPLPAPSSQPLTGQPRTHTPNQRLKNNGQTEEILPGQISSGKKKKKKTTTWTKLRL